jgi:SAM-dependent methyltransferase
VTRRRFPAPRYGDLLRRWDPMFSETIDPTRARRVGAILRALRARLRGPFTALELGTGPGPLAARLLDRFPRCRVVALDADPVLLAVGRRALRRFGGRITWVLADLRKRNWSARLPTRRVDCAVSSLVLHWLEANEIRSIYRTLGALVRPGGLVINGDFLRTDTPEPGSAGRPGARAVSRSARARAAALNAFKSEWAEWWAEVVRDPRLADAVRERRARLPGALPPRRRTGPRSPVSLEVHERAMRDAGFRRTEVVWQERQFRVLVGVR